MVVENHGGFGNSRPICQKHYPLRIFIVADLLCNLPMQFSTKMFLGSNSLQFSTIKVACWPAVNMDCNCTRTVSLFQECLNSINISYEKGNSLHKWICTIQIFMRKYFIVQQHAQNIINSLPNSHMVNEVTKYFNFTVDWNIRTYKATFWWMLK